MHAMPLCLSDLSDFLIKQSGINFPHPADKHRRDDGRRAKTRSRTMPPKLYSSARVVSYDVVSLSYTTTQLPSAFIATSTPTTVFFLAYEKRGAYARRHAPITSVDYQTQQQPVVVAKCSCIHRFVTLSSIQRRLLLQRAPVDRPFVVGDQRDALVVHLASL